MSERLVYLETYGCQMNDRDSERILALLGEAGYRPTCQEDKADLIVLNTCSIRARAEQKVYARLGGLKLLKKRQPAPLVAVSGCVAQQEREKLLRRPGQVDLVVGTGEISRFAQLLEEVQREKRPLVATRLEEREGIALESARPNVEGRATALVTIMEGCDNFCSYCIVPSVRGRERSRPAEEILKEVRELAAKGIKEVTLLGQNVNSYGRKNGCGASFPELLDRVGEVAKLDRIRFTTSHPRDLSLELIARFRPGGKLCEHIHLPVQSGSNRILRLMGRQYTREEYLKKVELLRKNCPGLAITTDFIVGFPGEREEDFRQTMALLEDVQFDSSFSFKFSPRPGTKAAEFAGQVPDQEKTERLLQLQQLQRQITLGRNRALEGKQLEVLVEGASKKKAKELCGRTRCNRVANFVGPQDLVTRLVKIKIEEGMPNSLKGRLI